MGRTERFFEPHSGAGQLQGFRCMRKEISLERQATQTGGSAVMRLNKFFATTRASILPPLAGAGVLLASGFALALEGAGPHGSLPAVRFGVAVGVYSAYFLVLWVASRASCLMYGMSATFRRNAAIAVLSLAMGIATFLAPLIPSASLAAMCLNMATCPETANPMLWSFLKLITALPMAPVLVGITVVVVPALTNT